MKKVLIISAVAALALVSCAKVQDAYVGEPQEIALSPLAQPATKSAVSTAVYPAGQSMYIAGYQKSPNAGDYFGETEFTEIGATGKWHGGVYWPLAVSTINFLGVTPGPAGTTRVWGTESANLAGKVVVTMGDNATAQHDLMWAIGQGNVTQASTNDPLVFPEVGMTYQHALAWVMFTEKVSATANGNIKLTSITLNSSYHAGTLTITNPNYNLAKDAAASAVTRVWSGEVVTATQEVPGWTGGESALTNTDSYTEVGNGLLVIPRTSSSAFASFTVAYQIKSPNGTWNNYTYTYNPNSPTNNVLEQGKKYIYNITFNLNEIIITPDVQTWDDYDFDNSTEGQQDKDITIL